MPGPWKSSWQCGLQTSRCAVCCSLCAFVCVCVLCCVCVCIFDQSVKRRKGPRVGKRVSSCNCSGQAYSHDPWQQVPTRLASTGMHHHLLPAGINDAERKLSAGCFMQDMPCTNFAMGCKPNLVCGHPPWTQSSSAFRA